MDYTVQRLFDKDYRYRFDPGANPTSSKQKQAENRISWVIDEIDDDNESAIVAQRSLACHDSGAYSDNTTIRYPS